MAANDTLAAADRFSIPHCLTFDQSQLGGPVARLAIGGATAEIALQGAQVLAWTPAGGSPAIWLSPTERLGTTKPVRGGTPVCWPWFANHPTDAQKPAHGFVRTRLWDIVLSRQQSDQVTLMLATATTEADRSLWPHTARAEISVTLSPQALSVALATENTGRDAFDLTQALHTYFAVSDITAVQVEGFDSLTYIDKLDSNARKTWNGPIKFAGEVDRIYLGHTADAAIVDQGAGRRIFIQKAGSSSSVVWNPWIDKCARLGDMGPEGYRTMVCVETANAGDDIVTLDPGGRHVLTVRYEIVTV
jgi:glucose-6-phosphate 1-epimerase